MPKVNKHPLVEVRWDDSASRSGWAELDEVKKMRPWKCRTRGLLIAKNKTEVIIAGTDAESWEKEILYGDRTTIPRKSVTEIRRVVVNESIG